METNSLKAFQELKDSGLLGKRQLEVYRIILEFPNLTDREIAEKLGEEDSKYYFEKKLELEKKLKSICDKHYDCLMKEQRQATLFNFNIKRTD